MRNISKGRLNFLCVAVFLLSSSAIFGAGAVSAQVPPLSSLPVHRPPNLADFIRDEEAARVLGKALFWDMQVGSDGVQACATCHFRAGADPRKKSQVSPGLLRVLFQPDSSGQPAAIPDADLDFDGQGPNDTLNLNPDPAPQGNCRFCHSGSLLSEASVDSVATRGIVRNSGGQLSDTGTRNIGVRETEDDLGNSGLDPFGEPLSVAVRDAPDGAVVAADGTFKIPGLRNVELTAPFFHNGGELTLLDVVKFYARGGNQGGASNPISTRDGTVIGGLSVLNFNSSPDADAVMADLVAFLESLTDERARIAAAPFDHPQIFVPNGHPGNATAVTQRNGQAVDSLIEIPATGRTGGPVLPGFLED